MDFSWTVLWPHFIIMLVIFGVECVMLYAVWGLYREFIDFRRDLEKYSKDL